MNNYDLIKLLGYSPKHPIHETLITEDHAKWLMQKAKHPEEAWGGWLTLRLIILNDLYEDWKNFTDCQAEPGP